MMRCGRAVLKENGDKVNVFRVCCTTMDGVLGRWFGYGAVRLHRDVEVRQKRSREGCIGLDARVYKEVVVPCCQRYICSFISKKPRIAHSIISMSSTRSSVSLAARVLMSFPPPSASSSSAVTTTTTASTQPKSSTEARDVQVQPSEQEQQHDDEHERARSELNEGTFFEHNNEKKKRGKVRYTSAIIYNVLALYRRAKGSDDLVGRF